MVMQVTKKNLYESLRLILLSQPTEQQDFEEELEALLSDAEEYVEFPQDRLDIYYNNMSPDSPGRRYMHRRGFTDDTIDFFKIGYKNGMVAVPVHSPNGIPVGVVGRSIEGKNFKNSKKLPTKSVWFNLHRAKRASDAAVVTEASFDAMKVHQAGFPNTIACLGSSISKTKLALLDRYFNKIIIMTDNRSLDAAGRKMGMVIADALPRKDINWATYTQDEVYPRKVKDAAQMSEEEIKQCVKNAVPHYIVASNLL